MVYTKLFSKWEKEKLSWRIKHLTKLKLLPGEIAVVGNIIRVLDKYYPSDDDKSLISYGNKTVVETAVVIYQMYHKRIWNYMEKKLSKVEDPSTLSYTEEEAKAELIARGFIPKMDVILDPKLCYIRSLTDNNLIYPEQWDLDKTYANFQKVGVTGFTGIKPPRSYSHK